MDGIIGQIIGRIGEVTNPSSASVSGTNAEEERDKQTSAFEKTDFEQFVPPTDEEYLELAQSVGKADNDDGIEVSSSSAADDIKSYVMSNSDGLSSENDINMFLSDSVNLANALSDNFFVVEDEKAKEQYDVTAGSAEKNDETAKTDEGTDTTPTDTKEKDSAKTDTTDTTETDKTSSDEKQSEGIDMKKDKNGKPSEIKDPYNTNQFKYDSEGNLTTVNINGTEYGKDNISKTKDGKTVIKNDDGKPVMTVETKKTGKTEIINYNSDGIKAQRVMLDSAGNAESHSTYDETGKIKQKVYNDTGAVKDYKWEDGKLVSSLRTNKDGTTVEQTYVQDAKAGEYFDNAEGLLVANTTYRDADGNVTSYTEYSFDKNGDEVIVSENIYDNNTENKQLTGKKLLTADSYSNIRQSIATGNDNNVVVKQYTYNSQADRLFTSDALSDVNIFNTTVYESDSKDGIMNVANQRATEDCWAVSAINSLKETEEGREILKNALEYHDGYTTVNLKGYGEVTVYDYELQAVQGTRNYTEGDDDMKILEFALEKVRRAIANGEAAIHPDYTNSFSNFNADSLQNQNESGKLLKDGNSLEAIYMLTGKVGVKNYKEAGKTDALDKFAQNDNKNITMNAFNYDSAGQTKQEVKDYNGNTVEITNSHMYSVKKVEGDKVTIVNPWDSSKEIELSRDVFESTFSNFESADISSNNESKSIIATNSSKDKDGNNVFKFDDGSVVTLSPDNSYQSYSKYGSDNNLKDNTTVIKKGNDSYKVITSYKTNGEIKNRYIYKYSDDGNSGYEKLTEEDAKKLNII